MKKEILFERTNDEDTINNNYKDDKIDIYKVKDNEITINDSEKSEIEPNNKNEELLENIEKMRDSMQEIQNNMDGIANIKAEVTPEKTSLTVDDGETVMTKESETFDGGYRESTTVMTKSEVSENDIKRLRKQPTQEEVEQKTGVPQTNISNMENK